LLAHVCCVLVQVCQFLRLHLPACLCTRGDLYAHSFTCKRSVHAHVQVERAWSCAQGRVYYAWVCLRGCVCTSLHVAYLSDMIYTCFSLHFNPPRGTFVVLAHRLESHPLLLSNQRCPPCSFCLLLRTNRRRPESHAPYGLVLYCSLPWESLR